MANLSVIIPTFNEDAYFEDALYSVRFADEIIVIDSFSNDQTVAIAKKYPVKFLQRKFDNYSNQKNFALGHATGNWVLFIDADERVTHSLKTEIIETIKDPKHNGYKITFPHFYMNRFLYHHKNQVLRLVKGEHASFSGNIHEKLQVPGSLGKLQNPMLHYTYKGLLPYIKKKENYAWMQAEQLHKKGKKITWAQLFFKPTWRFFSSFILKGGFRDGVPGLVVASVNAYGVFSRSVKVLLLNRGMR